MTMTKAILATLVLVGVLAGCATVTVQERRVVTGQVTDESGAPVAGNPVLVVARSLKLSALRLNTTSAGGARCEPPPTPGPIPRRIFARPARKQLLPVFLRRDRLRPD